MEMPSWMDDVCRSLELQAEVLSQVTHACPTIQRGGATRLPKVADLPRVIQAHYSLLTSCTMCTWLKVDGRIHIFYQTFRLRFMYHELHCFIKLI